MFHRPRCRDWSPLATQQLRLRNLIQISGHNIASEPKSSIYYTLHFTTMSAPFFTSERLEAHSAVIWPEINCPAIVKSTSQFVCIRVWQVWASQYTDRDNKSKGPVTATEQRTLATSNYLGENEAQGADACVSTTPATITTKHITDRVIFLWGVYFSGLIPITKRTDVRLCQNALVFHIHGGFFTSAEYLLPESIPRQFHSFFFDYSMFLGLPQQQQQQQQQMSLTPPPNCDQLGLSRNGLAGSAKAEHRRTEFRSPVFQNSMSQKPIGAIDIANISIANDQNYMPSPRNVAQSASRPRAISRTRSPTPTSPILARNEPNGPCDPKALKIRFLERAFYKPEIRPSYNVDKLLLLQEKQRRFRYKCDISKEIIDRICMKSAFCLNLQLIANKTLMYRSPARGNVSMGRTLNRLLSPQLEPPKPEVLLRAQELRRQIETARFRCRFLMQERDHHKINLRQLKAQYGRITDDNIENGSCLMADYRELKRDRALAIEQRDEFLRKRQILDNVSVLLLFRRKELLVELRDIFAIECDLDQQFYKINGIYLPNADAYGEFHVQSVTTPSSISAALGYVAHLVMLCSTILNIPLRSVHIIILEDTVLHLYFFVLEINRNKVIYKGSASRMRDDVKIISEHDREYAHIKFVNMFSEIY